MKTVIVDEDNTELECFVNGNGEVMLLLGPAGTHKMEKTVIALDKSDVGALIDMLTELESQMKD